MSAPLRSRQAGRAATVVAIFLVAAAALGGGLYFLFGVYMPGRARGMAQAEIERWEARLDKARACLLGSAPGTTVAEALAIQLIADRDFRKCTSLVGALTRDNLVDTGMRAVETAWRDVDRAAAGVASGFASAITVDPTRIKLDPLIDALANLDRAHQALREAARMDPLPATASTPLPSAALIEMPISSIEAWLRPSAGGLVALGSPVKSRTENDPFTQLVLVPGGAPISIPIRTNVRPSLDDPRWAAGADETGMLLGTLDERGDIKTPTKTATKLKPAVLFTLGTPSDGLVALSLDKADVLEAVAIARVSNNATVTLVPHQPAADFAFALDPTAKRGLLVWSLGGKLSGALLRAGEPTRIVELGSGNAGQSCLTASQAWVTSGSQFIEFDGATAKPRVLPNHEIVGCSDTAVLLRRAGHRYSVCTSSCRLVELAAAALAKPAIAGDQAIAVLAKGKLVAVWRERGAPLYFTLPKAMTPKLVHATATTVDVIGSVGDSYAIARVRL